MINIDDRFWNKVKQGWTNNITQNKDDIIKNNVKSILDNRKKRGTKIKKEIDFIMEMEEI